MDFLEIYVFENRLVFFLNNSRVGGIIESVKSIQVSTLSHKNTRGVYKENVSVCPTRLQSFASRSYSAI